MACPHWGVGIGLAWMLFLTAGPGALGQLAVSVISPPRTVSPGDVAIHVFFLSNLDASPVEVTLRAGVPPGWGQLGVPATVVLAGGGEEPVFLTVVVPRGATAGVQTVRLEATWSGGTASAEAAVRVLAVAGVEIVSPRSGEGQPGDSIGYELVIVNRGNVLDRFTVEASSAQGWVVRATPRESSLRPGEAATVRIVLSIPAQAEPGRDFLTAVVRTQEGAEGRAGWVTTVLPPGPGAVAGTVLSALGMRLGLSLGSDAISDRRLSRLTLTGGGGVLDGEVTLVASASGPWEPTPYRLMRLALSFDGPWAWVTLGEVGLDLSSLLLPLGAEGMGAGIRTDYGWAALLTGWRAEEARFGLSGAWVGPWGELGIALRETRGADGVRAGALRVKAEVGEFLTAEAEGGVAFAGGHLDAGLRVGLVVGAGSDFSVGVTGYAVGPNMPGPRADRAGMDLSGKLVIEPLGLRFTMRWERDNVLVIPVVPTVMRTELTAAWDWLPSWEVVGLFGTASLRRSQGFGPGLTPDAQVGSLGLSLNLGEAPLTVRLGGRWRWERDAPATPSRWIAEYEERISLTLAQTRATLVLAQAATRDELGTLVFTENDVRADLVTPAGIAVDFRSRPSGSSLGIGVPVAVAPSLSATVRVEARWGALGEVTSLFGLISFDYAFTWTPPFLPSKGWLEGMVFVDDNGNGRFDAGEQGIPNAVLVADGKRVASDGDGRFRFPPLPPGTYVVTLERVPAGFRSLADLPLQVEVDLAGRTIVRIPCERIGTISGVVYRDDDQSGTRSAGEPGVGRVRVVLERGGVGVAEALTTPLGSFSFTDHSAGEYRVRLDAGGLPERYEPTTPAVVDVKLAPGDGEEVLFGIRERPRPVVVVLQPPVADFTWAPPSPRAGEVTEFDAGPSLGRIVRYEWDFTGDRTLDAEGIRAEWTFPDAGVYLVTLVVTDDAGLVDEVSLLVRVIP